MLPETRCNLSCDGACNKGVAIAVATRPESNSDQLIILPIGRRNI